MMKSWSRLCFLVLAISSISRGENESIALPGVGEKDPEVTTGPLPFPDETQNQTTVTTPPSSSPQSHTSGIATDRLPTVSTTQEEETSGPGASVSTTTEGVNGSTAAQATASVSTTDSGDDSNKAVMSAGTSSTPAIQPVGHSSWGYVILILIILVIIILCVILYFLRRVSRNYSFDLRPHSPANHLNEPIGTFGKVYLDNLARPPSKGQVTTGDLSPPPVSNGTTLPAEEQRSNGESAPQEEASPTSVGASPTSNSSPSLGDDPVSFTNMFFDAIGEEQHNENNNNPSVCSSDPFVEINLDEAALCHQLLTSPEAPPSVFPFSFSSSSSSSSSSLHLH